MSPVSFDEEKQFARPAAPSNDSAGLSGWLIRKGIAADQGAAQRLMLLFAAVCIAIAGLAPILLGREDGIKASEIEIREAIRPLNKAR